MGVNHSHYYLKSVDIMPSRGAWQIPVAPCCPLLHAQLFLSAAGPAYLGPAPAPWLRTSMVATCPLALWSHLDSRINLSSPIFLQALTCALALMLQEGWLVPFLLVQLLLPNLPSSLPSFSHRCITSHSYRQSLSLIPCEGSAF